MHHVSYGYTGGANGLVWVCTVETNFYTVSFSLVGFFLVKAQTGLIGLIDLIKSAILIKLNPKPFKSIQYFSSRFVSDI